MLAPVSRLVGDYRVQLTVAQRGLINAKALSHILGKDTPTLGVPPFFSVLPTPVATEMTLVLALKQISVYVEEPLRRAARNRVSVQAYL